MLRIDEDRIEEELAKVKKATRLDELKEAIVPLIRVIIEEIKYADCEDWMYSLRYKVN